MSEDSSLRNKPETKNTSNVVSKIARQQSSPVPNSRRKPQHAEKVGQLSIDGIGYGGNKTCRDPPSRSMSVPTKRGHFYFSPTSSKTEGPPSLSSCSPKSDLNPQARGNNYDIRSTSRSSKSKSSGSPAPVARTNRRNNFESPPPSFPGNFSRSISLSPSTHTRQPNKNMAALKNVSSKKTITNFVKSGSREDTAQISIQARKSRGLGSASYRNIFSPVPSGHIDDEDFIGFRKSGLLQSSKSADDVVSYNDGGLHFPAITVEDCDGSSKRPLSSFENRDSGSLKKSVTVPGMASIETFEDLPSPQPHMASLNVPEPLVTRRTSEGRLIAAVNDDLLSGSLSKLRSRSEGNIPFALFDPDEVPSTTSHT